MLPEEDPLCDGNEDQKDFGKVAEQSWNIEIARENDFVSRKRNVCDRHQRPNRIGKSSKALIRIEDEVLRDVVYIIENAGYVVHDAITFLVQMLVQRWHTFDPIDDPRDANLLRNVTSTKDRSSLRFCLSMSTDAGGSFDMLVFDETDFS